MQNKVVCKRFKSTVGGPISRDLREKYARLRTKRVAEDKDTNLRSEIEKSAIEELETKAFQFKALERIARPTPAPETE
jgi:hypothetical protein